MTTAKLPFELSPDALSLWLQSLSEKKSANSAIELNNAVKLLRKNKTDDTSTYYALNTLTPTILHVSDAIETSLLEEAGNQSPTPKIIKLCIQLLRNTGLAFCKVSESKNLAGNQLNIAIYSALQLIGYSQRLSTLFFEQPSSTLWGKMGKVYYLSIQADNTQQTINHKIQRFKNQTSIESVLKRNILFNICNSQQYSASQIIEIFFISDQLSDKLSLNPSYSASPDTFHWNWKNKTPPLALNSTQKKENLTAAINTGDLIAFMQSKKFNSSLDQKVLTKLFDHLSGYQTIINGIVPSAPTIANLIIGFDRISEHLKQTGKLKKIHHLSGQPISTQQTENIELEPVAFEKSDQNLIFRTSASAGKLNLLSEAITVKTLQVQNKKYIIAETSYLNCSIGDLTLLCSSNLTYKLGIIRQVKITNASKTVHILIQQITGVPSALQLTSPQMTDHQILSIKTANTESDFFIPQSRLANGSQLTTASGKKYTLNKLIDYSPFFNRYRTSAL